MAGIVADLGSRLRPTRKDTASFGRGSQRGYSMRPMGRDQSIFSELCPKSLSRMGRWLAFLFAAAALLAAQVFAQAPTSSFVRANGPQLVTPDGRPRLLKGIN